MHDTKISAYSYINLHNCLGLARPVQIPQFVTLATPPLTPSAKFLSIYSVTNFCIFVTLTHFVKYLLNAKVTKQPDLVKI